MSSPTSTPDLAAIPEMDYGDWKNHPTWATAKQHKEKGLVPVGAPVAKVYYTNYWMHKRGQHSWLVLYDLELAQPKPMSAARRAGIARAKETAARNRTCAVCGQLNATKIKNADKLCDSCEDKQTEIARAREWLAMPNAVILDTETRDLHDEIIDVAVIQVSDGRVLLDTYIRPIRPIVEKLYRYVEGWYGDDYEQPTAYAIHGINNEMVKAAPYFTQVWPFLQTLLMFRTVLCYNAEYDHGVLRHDTHHNKFTSKIPGDWRCVMRFYSAYHGEWSYRHHDYKFVSLTDACLEQDVDTSGVEAHSALGDCMRTRALLQAIAAKTAPLDKKEIVYD